MISFDLKCSGGHQFEGWFRSSSDFDEQLAKGLLCCPGCGSPEVAKALSAPNVGRKGNQGQSLAQRARPEDAAPVSNLPAMPAEMQQMMHKLAKMQAKILSQSEWVGPKFAEEARAIHYGDKEDRLIHGEASMADAEALLDEGIELSPLLFPHVPDEAKN